MIWLRYNKYVMQIVHKYDIIDIRGMNARNVFSILYYLYITQRSPTE